MIARRPLLAALSLLALGAGCEAPRWVRPEAKLAVPGCRDAPDRQVLAEIREKVDKAKGTGRVAFAVFDLDDTLVDSATRTRAIFMDALRSSRAPAGAERAMEQLDYVCLSEYSTSLSWNLARAEFNEEIKRYLEDAWQNAALSERYVDRAVPMRGAAAFVRDLHKRGATIVYLTNRPDRQLRDATLRALDARGFPTSREGTLLVMQTASAADSSSWKADELRRLSETGQVVATFENEPDNVLLYSKVAPNASSVLFVSRQREGAPRVPDGTRCIVDYQDRP
jgi:hypothetical protein